MICWMSEGITVRAELPNGIVHAVALSTSRTERQPLSVFIHNLEGICALRCDLCPYCMSIMRRTDQTKGQGRIIIEVHNGTTGQTLKSAAFLRVSAANPVSFSDSRLISTLASAPSMAARARASAV